MNLIQLVTWGVTNRDVLLLATIRYVFILVCTGNKLEKLPIGGIYVDVLLGYPTDTEYYNRELLRMGMVQCYCIVASRSTYLLVTPHVTN